MGWLIMAIGATLISLGLIAIGIFGHNEAFKIFQSYASHVPVGMWKDHPDHIKAEEMRMAASLFQTIGFIALIIGALPLYIIALA